MAIYQVTDTRYLEKILEGCDHTLVWSCLQGYMGKAYADNLTAPKSVQIIVGDFCYFAGEVNEELIRNNLSRETSGFIIMTGENQDWNKKIQEVYGEKATKVTRYAIKKETGQFDLNKLHKIVQNMEKTYEIKLIDRACYEQIMTLPWACDFCSQFASYEEFENKGLGVVALLDGKIVSGASSYTVYQDGIEIQIDTEINYRRRGLALACAAKLIMECLSRGLYPNWDAQNKGSVALAEKLGYHFDYEYICFEIRERSPYEKRSHQE
ncbi:MAG: GNAT family N-acetyltransferase [bacterium]|nr:GNAT family N-acetyltransferase [bacterium]